jgi:hypothetical protein
VNADALLARLTAAGCHVTLRPDGRISLRPPPPPDLLAEARQHRDELARLCAGTTITYVEASEPRLFKPGVCPGDPPAPVVDPEASRTLVILELAGARPTLRPDGQWGLGRPEHASPELRAAAQLHQDGISALLVYRASLEKHWPVEAEPLPPPSRPP